MYETVETKRCLSFRNRVYYEVVVEDRRNNIVLKLVTALILFIKIVKIVDSYLTKMEVIVLFVIILGTGIVYCKIGGETNEEEVDTFLESL